MLYSMLYSRNAPKQYLTELKLKKACGLLRSTQLPVNVVAESLGFEDALAFSRVFKKAFGVSPHRVPPAGRQLTGLWVTGTLPAVWARRLSFSERR